MESAEQPTLPGVSQAFMETADVLLVLDDGAAVPCHSQILAMHSPVLCNMLKDLASEHNEVVSIPLADFTQAQCSALLGCLYYSISSKGAALRATVYQIKRQLPQWRVSHTLMTRRTLCSILEHI